MKPKRPKRYKKDRLDASAITPGIVAEWWSPRFGSGNPERMNNPLWEWLVRTRMEAYAAAAHFGYPPTSRCSDDFLGPAWCFARLGQSVTPLPDGRVVLISGEHEDYYDRDFNIHNDVTVCHPDGSLDIFGYPEEVFPPTDFHSATLIGDRIVIIGNLGYPKDRRRGVTQVAELDTATWRMRLVPASGRPPGWIHKHTAELSVEGRSIVLNAGLIDIGDADGEDPLMENPDQWSLDLENWKWSRITHKCWERYVFGAEGLRSLRFWKLRGFPFSNYARSEPESDKPSPRQVVPAEKWDEFLSRFGEANAKAQAEAADLYKKGFNPDLELYESLFRPDCSHQPVPEIEREETEEEEYNDEGPFDWDEEDYSGPEGIFEGTRILVDGVIVRYKESGSQVLLTIEGALPENTVLFLVSDLRRKLEILLARPVYGRRLQESSYLKS